VRLTKLFSDFFESEKAGGFILISCTVVSLMVANSPLQLPYIHLWHYNAANQPLEYWINDGLMAIFFLLIGLELEREIYVGELSAIQNAALPVIAAIGGILVPAAIHLLFNYNTPTRAGAGIPMATDIAFAIGILSIMGNRVPASLKVFLIALAVIDDLGAIITIAVFYSKTIAFINLAIAISIFIVLLVLNRLKVHNLIPYIIGGIAMWYFMLHSGIHATVTGILLAFVVPFGNGGKQSPSYILQHFLHRPVSFFILPVFALANTAIAINTDWLKHITTPNNIGIFVGLTIGKPLGIVAFSFIAVLFGWATLPRAIRWKHIIGIGLLGGIGFTMSIFITLLAFEGHALIDESKITVMFSSLIAAILGLTWLSITLKKQKKDINLV